MFESKRYELITNQRRFLSQAKKRRVGGASIPAVAWKF